FDLASVSRLFICFLTFASCGFLARMPTVKASHVTVLVDESRSGFHLTPAFPIWFERPFIANERGKLARIPSVELTLNFDLAVSSKIMCTQLTEDSVNYAFIGGYGTNEGPEPPCRRRGE